MESVTIDSATAFVALGFVVVVLLALLYLTKQQSDLRSQLSRLEISSRERSPAALVAAVADLDDAVVKLQKSMRSQFGQVWGTLGALKEPQRPETDAATNGERPSRDNLRKMHLRPPLPPTAE